MTKIEQFLSDKGFDLSQLKKDTNQYSVTNLAQAASMIKNAIDNQKHIHVVADYDADGIMSGSILYLVLTELGADFTLRFPGRMSDGYGINQRMVDEAPANSMILTVDNGIAAIEAIDYAKSLGMEVVVLDHHQQRGDGLLPNADCIVDPHIFKEEDEFEDYCGAGLSYMLAKELGLPTEILTKANALAAIATIQDVVSLTGNNRNIVKYGLAIINKRLADLPGLYSLCAALKLIPTTDKYAAICEEDIAFQIGPCVNAMGRMLDDGAKKAFEYLMHYDIHGEDGIRAILDCNTTRKEETTRQQNILEIEAERIKTPKMTCMVLYAPALHEGLIGINAARVVEKYNMPAVVLTDAENGLLKGSARSLEGIDIKDCLDQVAEFIYQYGGHAGAAGLSVEKDKLDDFVKAINKVTPKAAVNANTWQYDIEVEEDEIPQILEDIKTYAPFGEGFPAPVIKVNGYNLAKNYGKYYRYIGDNGVSMNGNNSEAISFSLKEKYQTYGTPLNLNIIGTVGYSRFSKRPQIMIVDFQPMIAKQEAGFLL